MGVWMHVRVAVDSSTIMYLRQSKVDGSHLQTLAIYKLGFNQRYYTFTLILLMKIVP